MLYVSVYDSSMGSLRSTTLAVEGPLSLLIRVFVWQKQALKAMKVHLFHRLLIIFFSTVAELNWISFGCTR